VVFGNDAPRSGKPNTSPSDSPQSVDLSTNPSTSSTAVELGYTSDENLALASKRTTEPELRPAAEVFGFLLEKRRSRNSIPANKEPSLAICPTRRDRDFGSSTDQIHAAPATPKAKEASASLNTPSTIGSILFDPPHTATILNHTRIPVAHGRLTETLRPGQLAATATATRRCIPNSLRNLTRTVTSASETYLPSTCLGEPVKPTREPTSCDGVLRSTTNTTEQTTCLSSKQGTTFASVPVRTAHRRSASYGSSRILPVDWIGGPNAVVRMARNKGLKPDYGKENNRTLCTFSLFHASERAQTHSCRSFGTSQVSSTRDPFS
jgi:hypothetical protein